MESEELSQQQLDQLSEVVRQQIEEAVGGLGPQLTAVGERLMKECQERMDRQEERLAADIKRQERRLAGDLFRHEERANNSIARLSESLERQEHRLADDIAAARDNIEDTRSQLAELFAAAVGEVVAVVDARRLAAEISQAVIGHIVDQDADDADDGDRDGADSS